MNCIICWQTEIEQGFTSIVLERDEIRLIINSVPAHICRQCGEAYMDENIGIQLLNFAGETVEEGMFRGEWDYAGIAKDQ